MDANLELANLVCIVESTPRSMHFGGYLFHDGFEACRKVFDAYQRLRGEEWISRYEAATTMAEQEKQVFVNRIAEGLR